MPGEPGLPSGESPPDSNAGPSCRPAWPPHAAPDAAAHDAGGLTATDSPPAGTFEAIFKALEASSLAVIGPAIPRLLVIPIRDGHGAVAGGLWGCTMFGWLHVQMLFVPEPLRRLGIGAALMASAEADAWDRGCRGAYVDAFSFQAASFYQRIGYTMFGKLTDCPPGHDRLYFRKHFAPATHHLAADRPLNGQQDAARRREGTGH